MPPVHSFISDDLATKILLIFSSRCSHMSPTTYPKTAASRIETQPGSHPSWLLPHVCTHSVHMIEILILFLRYYDIFSMHRPHHSMFPYAFIISTGAFTKLDHDATRNVIGAQSATFGQLGPTFLPCHLPVSYYLRLPLVLDIMKICTDFCPYDIFRSSDVPEMVDQQNSRNSLVIGTCFLYLA
jgi:hypothetical protein